MKLKNGLMIHETPDGVVAVATGDAARSFNGMLRLSKTAESIVRALQTETTIEAVADALMKQYDVDRETVTKDIEALVEKLTSVGLME